MKYLIMVFAVLMCLGCTKNPTQASGGSVETTNGISGTLVGDSVNMAIATLYPNNFDVIAEGPISDTLIDTVNSGQFSFKDLPEGLYNLEISSINGSGIVLLKEISLDSSVDTIVDVGEIEMKPPGTISIEIKELKVIEGGYFYIPGTSVNDVITIEDINSGKLEISGVPEGVVDEIIYKDSLNQNGVNILDDKSLEIKEIKDSLTVESEGVIHLGIYFQWAGKKKVIINTSSTGANLSQDLINYPLLLRLDSSNFDFNQAREDGSDLRFSNENKSVLSYQIEYWSKSEKQAVLWVLLDTIYGNNDSQFIHLHFGNSEAVSISSGSMVFDTANGFTSVFHLDDGVTGRGAEKNYRDATINEFHGNDSVTAETAPGLIGLAQDFNGDSDFVELPPSHHFIKDTNQTLTLSGWFYADTIIGAGALGGRHRIIDIHRSDTNGSAITVSLRAPNTLMFYNHGDSSNNVTNTKVEEKVWNYFALTYDGTQFRMYLNGDEDMNPVAANLIPGGNFTGTIGRYGYNNMLAFDGILDEMRISHVNRSAAWVKMNFECQKMGSTVVRLEP